MSAAAVAMLEQQASAFDKQELAERFLLHVNFEWESGYQDFMTSRARIVRLERDGDVFRMVDESTDAGAVRLFGEIPIRAETPESVMLDLNEGFDRVYNEEDRTGEDYYGRVDKHDYRARRLYDRRFVSAARHGDMRVFDQAARAEGGEPIVVHYYLTPYRQNPGFHPFELENLDRIGFYQTYPQQQSGRSVMYATKFDTSEPVVFALSSAIPERYRAAVRDGVEYWNRALGMPLIRAIDAPSGVHAPSPDYNVIEWTVSGRYTSTSHIQIDPLTGEILHAHVFVLPDMMMDGDLTEERDHLAYIVAHEIGHALGLRHNFGASPDETVMGYLRWRDALRIGRDVRAGAPALPYDRQVVRHVYLGAPLDLATLPPFCTDDQRGCSPFALPPVPAAPR